MGTLARSFTYMFNMGGSTRYLMKRILERNNMITAASALTSLSTPSLSPIGDDAPETNKTNDTTKQRPDKFPQRLMKILSDESNSTIISWLPHGKSFIIRKKDRFINEVLPLHFKQLKYTSFTRKLHRWGFILVRNGQEKGSYYHKSFQRGRMDLCHEMSCKVLRTPENDSDIQPTPAVPLDIIEKIQQNNRTIKKLAAIVSFQKKALLQSQQQNLRPVISLKSKYNPSIIRHQTTPISLTMDPNSDVSSSIISEAIAALNRCDSCSPKGKTNSQVFVNVSKKYQIMNQSSINRKNRLPSAA